ncbi:unnamed protein product [Cylicostephanus goldi]|uniref:Uncharacterized protein n=1 Tax=Cylicostephanus goldi TaxID=71465 RepID=A0A3P6U6M2_CYLGO|nr:unnamed protein product [Cylicostephanus goldi]
MYRPKEGKDTQVFYQNMRSLSTSIGGLAVLFFHHPGIFNIWPTSCNLWFVISTCCFSLGICFFALEALNVFQVILSERKNVWGNALVTTVLPIQEISDYTLAAAFTTGSVVMLAAATQHSKATSLIKQ